MGGKMNKEIFMPHLKIKQMRNGDIQPISDSGIYYTSCCDCGLIHLHRIWASKDGTFLASYRDDYLTERFREQRKKKKPKKKVKIKID